MIIPKAEVASLRIQTETTAGGRVNSLKRRVRHRVRVPHHNASERDKARRCARGCGPPDEAGLAADPEMWGTKVRTTFDTNEAVWDDQTASKP
jgi:hypothetical protein